MKMKKVLSVLLAICLMVGMVAVLASAEEAKQAYIKMPFDDGVQEGVKINQGDEDMYFLSTEKGFATKEGATAENYNIKLSYPAGGTPTLYLNNATIISPAPGTMENGALMIGYDVEGTDYDIVAFDFVINVEADSVIKGDWRTYDGTAGNSTHGSAAIIGNNAGTLTVTGPGLLDVFNNCNACILKNGEGEDAALIFRDAYFKGVKDNPQPRWGDQQVIDAPNTNVIFDNTVADMTNNHQGIVNTTGKSPETGKIIIKNGSDIKGITTSNGVWSSSILNAPEGITVDDSDVLLHGVGESQYAVGRSPVELIGVNAIGGIKEANAVAFKKGRASEYMYFLAGPDVVIETAPPATTKPAETEPTATEPEATKPAATKPAATKPAATKPAATKPAATKPVATKPVATKPVETRPVVTDPFVTDPVVTDPAATEPVVTDPAVTEPVVTDPVVTEPGVTDPTDTETGVTDPTDTETTVTDPVETAPTGETITGTLDIPAEVLADRVLTEEEREQMQQGVSVHVNLAVKDITAEVSLTDRALVEAVLTDNVLGMYLDITLSKQLGEEEPVNVTETDGPITVAITVPMKLRNNSVIINRIYKMIRVHEGKADVLEAVYDGRTGKVAFDTDGFSTYALVYTDIVIEQIVETTPPETQPTQPTQVTQATQATQPTQVTQPNDTVEEKRDPTSVVVLIIVICLLVLSLGGIAFIILVYYKKDKDENAEGIADPAAEENGETEASEQSEEAEETEQSEETEEPEQVEAAEETEQTAETEETFEDMITKAIEDTDSIQETE